MVVWAVQAARGESLHQPSEQRLVTYVHAEGHLRLLAIAAERPFADQQSDDDAALKLRQTAHTHFPIDRSHALCTATPGCFTVKKNVKPAGAGRGRRLRSL